MVGEDFVVAVLMPFILGGLIVAYLSRMFVKEVRFAAFASFFLFALGLFVWIRLRTPGITPILLMSIAPLGVECIAIFRCKRSPIIVSLAAFIVALQSTLIYFHFRYGLS